MCCNLQAIAAAGADLDAAVKLAVLLNDSAHFTQLDEIMSQYFNPPYPQRSAVGVSEPRRLAPVEIDAILAEG